MECTWSGALNKAKFSVCTAQKHVEWKYSCTCLQFWH